MNRRFKGILAVLLCIILSCGILPVSAESVYTATDGTYNAEKAEALLEENQSVTFDVSVPADGKYRIGIDYTPVSVRNETVDYNLKIDGESPFETDMELSLPVDFYDDGDKFAEDSEGNQIPPELLMQKSLRTYYISDPEELIYGDYLFNLTAGQHQITLTVIDGKASIKNIYIKEPTDTLSYDKYLEKHKVGVVSAEPIVFEAERPYLRTTKSIAAFCDMSSSNIYPEAEKIQIMNAIGGDQWKYVGQDVTWSFKIDKSGYYKFYFKYRQNYTNGRNSYRALLIDDELPFAESQKIAFPYNGSWDTIAAGDEEPYLYWLDEGEHTITLQATLGDMADIIKECRDIMLNLNSVYRRVVTITGTDPDVYRDYQLDKKIPETIEQMSTEAERLNKVLDDLAALKGRGTESGALERLVNQLEKMHEFPEKCAPQITQFQNNISAFGSWINERYSQPLALDRICITPDEDALDRSGFFAQAMHSIRQFLYSFGDDYNYEDFDENSVIDVWALTGRDQVQIIKRLLSESFTPNSKIGVDLKLVSEAAVLPATAAGQGPDVCLMTQQGMPVNFATRDSVLDLSKFKGFDDVKSRFYEESLTSFEYNGGTYALPETMTFPMLFYRKDILENLNLSVPTTWDELYQLIVDLNNNNMQFGFMGALQNYLTMLYQKGGEIYSEDSTHCLLDENTALLAFEDYSSLYREYGIPVTFDFVNRFRSGSMPVAITDYAQYNTLQIFASEINGMWDIAPVPATKTEDGLNSSVAGTVTGCVIFSDADNPEACWSFLEWWTRSDIQEKYGRRVEEKLGASSRYATANKDTLANLPWSLTFYNSLSEQMQNVRGVPQVPGGYFLVRHFDNAYRKAVYKNANPRETLIEYTRVIDSEITVKRKEFGLNLEGEGK